ncbi:hypothetical protein SSYRP_v1c09600 [Spiroplasma syrphidicola EA-1]|uniref:Lipoprotein n=1 Tax=Spiroplasma syrphidicola EA-1 TaxID=1276229 RepID=R4U4Z0_9MOLU|nr:lipoprotein [Spiroplasma syrphidicola]AGM26547.1 hypothetical protein SSYRP_v1c09600 [Spiroplasma syrphidicola EA-1]
MKKLLSILSSLVLTGTAASGVIACSSKDENKHKNSNGDSIWAWLPGIYGGQDVTSPDIWNTLTTPNIRTGQSWSNDPNQWDGSTQLKMSKQLMQILSVAILANPEKFLSDNTKKDINIADYHDLSDILKAQWKLLVQATNNSLENKIQDFKNSAGKNWEKEYHKFLDDNYPDISGASGSQKYKIEEENFKAAMMTQGVENTKSASALLTEILLNNNMRTYNTNDANSATPILKNFNEFLRNNSDEKNWPASINDKIQLALAFNYDFAKGDYLNPNDSTSLDLSNLTLEIIDKYLANIAKKLKDAGVNYDVNKFLQQNRAVATPIFRGSSEQEIGTPSLNLPYDTGQYSMFQKYMIDKWFQNEKPLAYSEVVYNFKTDAKVEENGIKSDSFDQSAKDRILADLTTLKTNDWSEFIKKTDQTVTASDTLVTLNSDKSGILKASLYDGINQASQTKAIGALPTTFDDLMKPIDRSNGTQLSKAWKIGTSNDYIIAYFDVTDGLHIAHIDGNEFLLDSTSDNKLEKLGTFNNNWQFRELNYSRNVYSQMTDKSQIIVSKDKGQQMNTHFSDTQYLWYLANRSLVNTSSPATSPLKFNLLSEVKSYAGGDSSMWWTWIFDFFNNYANILQLNNDKWYTNFLTFKDSTGTTVEPTWFINQINAADTNISGGALSTLRTKLEEENTKIKNYKENGPALTIETNKILKDITEEKFWTTNPEVKSSVKNIVNINPNTVNLQDEKYSIQNYQVTLPNNVNTNRFYTTRKGQ